MTNEPVGTRADMSARSTARPMEVSLESFGKRLRELLVLTRISQVELSRRTGISRSSITLMLTGKNEPTLGTLLSLASGLGLHTIDELLTPSGPALLVADLSDDREDPVSSPE